MLLAVDVGNTHIVLGVFRDTELVANWRLQSKSEQTVDEYALQIVGLLENGGYPVTSINQIIISCVVPVLTRVFTKLSQKYFQIDPLVVGPGIKTGIVIACDDPRSVGADRIVNAVAMKEEFGTPGIVVDFGTATTFDVVSEEGAYEGGLIAPGVLISADALSQKAAMLPSIELSKPAQLIGKNTRDSMLAGIYYGYVALVEGIIGRLRSELKSMGELSNNGSSGDDPKVVATGGLARIFAEECRGIDTVVPDLTLRGLQIVARQYR